MHIDILFGNSFLLRMRNVVDKSYMENKNTHFMYYNFFFSRKPCRLWDNMENMVEPGGPQMTVWRMRIVCWILKSLNTHWGCVILIAFSLQQLLYERASALHVALYVHGLSWRLPIPCIFSINYVFNNPTKRTYTIKYTCQLSHFLLNVSAFSAPSSERTFLYAQNYWHFVITYVCSCHTITWETVFVSTWIFRC